MVHGFRYDPRSGGRDNPHLTTFVHWRRNVLQGRDAFGFGWYSAPGGFRLPESLLRAWLNGRWNTYRYAWDLAHEAGNALAKVIVALGQPVDLLCHSLGSRVVLRALEVDPGLRLRSVVLLNGAELARTALPIASRAGHVRFRNLVVASDDVLRTFGGLFAPGDLYAFTIGQAGLGALAPANWLDIALDDPDVRDWARAQGWPDVRGDNPAGYWDHWYTHKHPGNWGLLRGLLDGREVSPASLVAAGC